MECTSGSDTATADADFTAGWAPVDISGFENASQPAGDADSVEVSADFDVIPAGASCRVVTPADAIITPTTGGTRTVSLDVDAGEAETVTVRCANGTQTDDADAVFAATAVGGCNSELGTFSDAGTTVSGTISSQGGCTSQRRTDRTHYARRHILRLAHPGWVTATLEADAAYPGGPDTYLLILAGDAADGSGRRLAYNDDHRSGYDTHSRNSRIVDKFLHAGTYTIEATTYYWHNDDRPDRTTGDYTLHVTVDYTPRAAGQPVELSVENGTTVTSTWNFQPGAATVQLASAFPEGIDAAVEVTSRGRATLSATPSAVGQYAVQVTYANGPAPLTKATTINSYCPDGQDELPGDCAAPLAVLDARDDVDIGPMPSGFEQSRSCFRAELSDGAVVYTCRELRTVREYISKTSPLIVGVSPLHGAFGTALTLVAGHAPAESPSVLLEGCQSITAEYWQCDYRAERLWMREVETLSAVEHVLHVLPQWLFGDSDNVLDVLSCSEAVLALWGSGLRDAQAWASALTSCPQTLTPLDTTG